MTLYIHIPFCASKCGYCAFNSQVIDTHKQKDIHNAYVKALIHDLHISISSYQASLLESRLRTQTLGNIKHDAANLYKSLPSLPHSSSQDLSTATHSCTNALAHCDSTFPHHTQKAYIDSIYIGGGTPSLLAASAYEEIFSALDNLCHLSCVKEISIEANPNALTQQWCNAVFALGVGRISLGVQSFFTHKLAFLEREHKLADIMEALDAAHRFLQKSIDIIYGTPLDSTELVQAEIERACALPITHFSAYSLMIEKGARFYEKHHSLASHSQHEHSSALSQCVREVAVNQGFFHYEVANFARLAPCASASSVIVNNSAFIDITSSALANASSNAYNMACLSYAPQYVNICLHNRAYWLGGEYLGCGAGAVGRVGQVRYKGASDIARYIHNPLAKSIEILEEKDKAFEMIFLGLRSAYGFSLTHTRPYIQESRLHILLEEGVCSMIDDRVIARDLFLADEIALYITR